MILIERLTIDGVEIPVSAWDVNTPTDGMGMSLRVTLASSDPIQVLSTSNIKFEYGARVETAPGVFTDSYAPPVINNGRLNGRNYVIRWAQDDRGGKPGDTLEFSSFSPLADRYSKSPESTIIMYDPELTDGSNLIPPQDQLIRIIRGTETTYLTPELKPTVDLNLQKVLDAAYVTGCGLDRVITNLPNPRIDRVDFTIEGGYHDAAKALVNQYALEVLAFEDNNVLYILDPDRGLPVDFPVKALPPDCYIELQESIAPIQIKNAIILSYKQDPGTAYAGEYPQEKIIDEPGTPTGEDKSYQRQDVRRHITEYYDEVTDALRRTVEHEIVVSNYGWMDDISISVTGEGTPDEVVTRTRVPGGIRLLSEETLENSYTGNTKAGHTRTVKGWYSDPSQRGLPVYTTLLKETYTADWVADLDHPGESKLSQGVTYTEGLVLKEINKKDGLEMFTPIVDADIGNLIKSDLSQSVQWLPIETVVESLRKTAINQSNVETRIVDHLNGRNRGGGVQSRPGANSTYLPNFNVSGNRPGYIRELIRDEESIALYGLRKPDSLDVGRLDPVEGRALARRKLRYSTNAPKRLSILLPGINFSLRRGSIVAPSLRSGYAGKYIVTGLAVNATGCGTPAASRRMRLDVRELKA